MNTEILKYIYEIENIFADTTSNFSLWWEVTRPKNNQKYLVVRKNHNDFFLTIENSTLDSTINGLHMLLENRLDTRNLNSLLDLLIQEKPKLEEKLRNLDKNLKECHSENFKKIVMYRSNVSAHRGKKLTSNQFVERAELRPSEVKKIINDIHKIFSQVLTLCELGTLEDFSKNTRDSTTKLMDSLVKINA